MRVWALFENELRTFDKKLMFFSLKVASEIYKISLAMMAAVFET